MRLCDRCEKKKDRHDIFIEVRVTVAAPNDPSGNLHTEERTYELCKSCALALRSEVFNNTESFINQLGASKHKGAPL
jgi:hypothetical protein